MATIINNPGNGDGGGSSIGIIIAVVMLIVVAGLFVVYGLPRLQNASPAQSGAIDVNVKLPAPAVPAASPTPAP